jgi:SAM-dependent methyltransferase
VRSDAPCPVCGENRWESLRSQTFSRLDDSADGYVKARIDVLLDVWRLGSNAATATIVWSVCKACGFLSYLPRPTAQDVAAKYQALATGKLPPARKRPAGAFKPTKWDEGDKGGAHRARAAALFELLSPWLVQGSAILDFGGGSGRLMRDFVLAGHRCQVLDYGIRAPLPGVGYAGSTFQELDRSERYDLVICSHVLEHVAEPIEDLRSLCSILKDGGLLYVEVPCEISCGGPTPREPVTHINYFSAGPMRTLLERAGARVIGCHYAPFINYERNSSLAVKALATAGRDNRVPAYLGGADPVKALMAGSLRPLLSDWLPGSFPSRDRGAAG